MDQPNASKIKGETNRNLAVPGGYRYALHGGWDVVRDASGMQITVVRDALDG